MKIHMNIEFDSLDEASSFLARDKVSNPIDPLAALTASDRVRGSGAWPFGGDEEKKGTVERKNVSPGEPAITKIGTDTMKMLIEQVKVGIQPEKKYLEHAKLLWKRDLLKFDDVVYWLP